MDPQIVFIAVGAALLASTATFALSARLFRRPVRELTRAAQAMAKGDREARASVDDEGELGSSAAP